MSTPEEQTTAMEPCPLCQGTHAPVCGGVLELLQRLDQRLEELEDRKVGALERAHQDFVATVRRAGR